MAKIGLKYPVYKGTTNQGVIGKAIQADIAITVNNVFLYGDDGVAESDKSFQSGTITFGTDDLRDEIQIVFLGHTKSAEGEITAKGVDDSPYVGIGFYGVKKVSGVRKYRAVWLPKVQFGEPNDANTTKGETVTFNTPVLEGAIMLDDNGDWKKEQTFDTEAEAIVYLQNKSGVKAQSALPVSSLESGIYTAAQANAVTLTAADADSIHYTLNGTTPSATNGEEYAAPIAITESCALRAVSVKAGLNGSSIANYEYIITA